DSREAEIRKRERGVADVHDGSVVAVLVKNRPRRVPDRGMIPRSGRTGIHDPPPWTPPPRTGVAGRDPFIGPSGPFSPRGEGNGGNRRQGECSGEGIERSPTPRAAGRGSA